MWSIAV
jgi:hypothetical protein